MAEPWWSGDIAPFVGAGAGIVGGTLGAISGSLAGYLAHRGRGRKLVTWLFASEAAAGWIMLAVGFYALASGQPWHVWYVLLLSGVVFSAVCTPLLFMVNHVYRKSEERRLVAEELRRS